MHYKTLTIKNFRGIESLEIQDLKRTNLIVGRNNCGKSSILESFFLLSGMSNPQLPIVIHNLRDMLIQNDTDFGYLFHNTDIRQPILIDGKTDGVARKLKITPLLTAYGSVPANKTLTQLAGPASAIAATNTVIHTVDGLSMTFHNGGSKYDTTISIKNGGVTTVNNYREKLACAYINSRTAMLETEKHIEKLLIQKRLEPLIEILKGVEPDINDIRLGAGGRIYVDVGVDQLMPINIMGDGMRRILVLLSTIQNLKDGVVLIDEIENGFHYSSMKILWKALHAAAREFNVQIIASSHSSECIEAFSSTYEESEPDGDEARLFRIEKSDSGHTAYPFTSKSLRAGIENEIEVR